MIYLDCAASTPLSVEVVTVLADSFSNDFASPSANHSLGRELENKITQYRKYFTKILNASDYRFIFTSSASESNNMVIRGKSYSRIILSKADHPSMWEYFNQQPNVNCLWIGAKNNGRYDVQEILEQVTESTDLVLLSHVNNYSGTIQDVFSLAQKIKDKNRATHVHVDAVQSFGKIKISLKDNLIDSLAISAHKIGGPKGIAGLYLSNNTKISPLLFGGGQELGLRSSTQAFPLIKAFVKATELSFDKIEESLVLAKNMNQFVFEAIKKEISSLKFPFIENSSPYILTFITTQISSDIILRHLEQEGIIISSSSACSSKIKEKNPAYEALGIALDQHKFVLRLSMGRQTSFLELEEFVNKIIKIYQNLAHIIKR